MLIHGVGGLFVGNKWISIYLTNLVYNFSWNTHSIQNCYLKWKKSNTWMYQRSALQRYELKTTNYPVKQFVYKKMLIHGVGGLFVGNTG
jgi:hypothetical protein